MGLFFLVMVRVLVYNQLNERGVCDYENKSENR